ncbi:class I SAM-dependent methyltransferase [Viscerimonas tarda]
MYETIILKNEGNDKYRKEIDFLQEEGKISVFSYKKLKHLGAMVSGYDAEKNLPYVMHKHRRLYFPITWTEAKVRKSYKDFIENENILGGGYLEKSPHQYQTETFRIKAGDILLDVGCAEALFALDVIDKIRKVFLFESNPLWFAALKATFEGEIASGKVVLIEKYVGDEDTDTATTLDSVLKKEVYESLFIKMDIEGAEPAVVKSCENLMKTGKDIRFSCCTYHKHNDAALLKSIFEANNYQTEFSEGYMLFTRDGLMRYPFFRRGIIRASHKEAPAGFGRK